MDNISVAKSLLTERIEQAREELTDALAHRISSARRQELAATVDPIQALPIPDRAGALAAAGVTVEQFQAAVAELSHLNGQVSTAEHLIRHLEAELADLEATPPQDAWMQLPVRSLSKREENIIGNIEQAVFDAHSPAREAAQAVLAKAKGIHEADTSPTAERAIRGAQDALIEADNAQYADERRIIWLTALRLAFRAGILAYADAMVKGNYVQAQAVLLRTMMESSDATDQAIATAVDRLLTDGPGLLAILGNQHPGMDPLFRK